MKKIIVMLLVLPLLFVGCASDEEDNTKKYYDGLEKTMLAATESFFEINEEKLPTVENTVYSVKLEWLEIGNYLPDGFKAEDGTICNDQESMVTAKMLNGEIVYKIFLECDNYKTEN